MSLLDASHLHKNYNGITAVDDVSFQVDAGEVFGLLGPNGAGKTTTMMMLAGLLKPDKGSVSLDGQPLSQHGRDLKPMLGVVPQDLALYPELTARENLLFFARLYGLRGKLLARQTDRVLEQTGLTDRAASRVATYSGGMKRRLNFGIALLHEPRLLILDEPTVGVDPQSRAHLLDCVRQLSVDGIAVLYASHYMEEVEAVCQRVGIMDHGRMIAYDSLTSLLGGLQSDLCVSVSPASDQLVEQLTPFADVQRSSADELTVTVARSPEDANDLLNGPLMQILQAVRQCGGQVRSVATREPNLERLFLKLTGNRLRD